MISIFLLFSLFLFSKPYIILSQINSFHQNHTDNDTDPDPEPTSKPNPNPEPKDDQKIVKVNGYYFKNFTKKKEINYKIEATKYQEYHIILVCSKENTMTISNSETSRTTRLFLVTDYSLDYDVVLLNNEEDYFFEVSFIPKLFEFDLFTTNFEKEYHKMYSPQNYIYVLVDYPNFKDPSLLYYDPYISYPQVKYIPLKENTKFDDIFYSEVESYDFIHRSYVPKDKYFVIKIKTNSSYDFYVGLKNEFYDGKTDIFLYPTAYNQYLLKENQWIHLKKINNERGISVSLLAQSNPNVKIYLDEHYSRRYLNQTNREELICCSTVVVQALNGYALVAGVESSDTFGSNNIQYVYYGGESIAPYQTMPLFRTHGEYKSEEYNMVGLKITISHFGSIKCNLYDLGGFKQRGYYVGNRGWTGRLSYTGIESISHYYPSDLINENSFGDGQYGIPLYCPCCQKYTADYKYELRFIYFDENNFKYIGENTRNVLYNNSNYEDFDNVTYKIAPPKSNNQYLKIQISNCRNNHFNFHLLKKFNVSYYTLFSISQENDILLPINLDKNEISNLDNLYVFFESFTLVSFEYEYINLDPNYKIKYSSLEKKVNMTIGSGKSEIEFYPILFDEEMEYKLYILEHQKSDISRKCLIYYNNNNDLKSVDIGNYIINQNDENYTIKTNFEFEFKNKDYYSIVLMAYQKNNNKYKFLYDTNYYSKSKNGIGDSSDEDSSFFEKNKTIIFIGAGCLVLIIIIVIIIVIIVKKKKNSDGDLVNEVEELKENKDPLLVN